MVNPPPVLNQLTWGVRLNFERFLASPTTSPDWLAPLQQQDWQHRGLIVWDVELRLVAHLYAGYALDILEHMRAIGEWKTSGFLIGSPTHQLPINRITEQLHQTANGIWSLQNEIELAPNRAQVFFDFLISYERSLEHISICDKEDAEEALGKVYRLMHSTMSPHMAGRFEKEDRARSFWKLPKRRSSQQRCQKVPISLSHKPRRFVTPHQSRSEHGFAEANLRQSNCQV